MAHAHNLRGLDLSDIVCITSREAVEDAICDPPCECPDCQNGFYGRNEQYMPPLAYRSQVSDEHARAIVSSYVKQVHGARARLAERLKHHADVLMSRWRKRSQDKRQALLKEVAPELEQSQWILTRYSYMEERKDISFRSPTRRRHLLLPWLSVEVLKKDPAILFALLHYRTVYPPQDWAAWDCRQLTLSWACGWLDVDFSAKCVVMYGPKYGDLVDWNAEQAHRADILGFPRARLVLEAQGYLMTTLCRIVDKILDKLDDTEPIRVEKWRQLTTTGFRRVGEVELWSPYVNQAFSAPPVLDIDYLLSLAKTRLDAMSDHLWHLQCDPAYMRRYMKILLATAMYKVASKVTSELMVASDIVMEYHSYCRWRWVEIECRHVQQVQSRFRESCHPGQPLPVQCDRALGALELFLVNQVIYRVGCLESKLPYAPGFSNHWTIKRLKGAEKGFIQLTRDINNNTKEALEGDPLDWCLSQMVGLPDTQTHFDHAMLFALLQDHLAGSTHRERARLDEIIYQRLSDISTCHEMLVLLRLHRPQNSYRILDEVQEVEDREAWKRQRSKLNDPPAKALQAAGSGLMTDFYSNAKASPAGPRNMAWLAQSRAARASLERFWTAIRDIIRGHFRGSAFSAEEVASMLEVVAAHQSPEYLALVHAEEEAVRASVEKLTLSARSASSGLADTTEDHATTATSGKLTISLPPRQKEKPKTRPAHPPPSTAAAAIPEAEHARPPSPRAHESHPIPASKRALDVLALMFPATAEEAAKSVRWDALVLAMADVGFIARSNGGSAVLFENSSTDAGGKIVFHRPHPEAKVDPVTLQAIGKRMNKWFGWERKRFVLDQGVDAT